jgi:hypothetical protein
MGGLLTRPRLDRTDGQSALAAGDSPNDWTRLQLGSDATAIGFQIRCETREEFESTAALGSRTVLLVVLVGFVQTRGLQ